MSMIDVHTHLSFAPIYPKAYLLGMVRSWSAGNAEDKLMKVLTSVMKDRYGDMHVAEMQHSGIAQSVLLIIDGGIALGEAEMSIQEIHELHRDVMNRHAGKFIVFAGIDPRRGRKGIELFERAVYEYGFKGLKLYPPMGYNVDDPQLIPYFEICNENKLTVLIHTGPSLPTLQNERADPNFIYPIAQSFRNVNFILAHAAYQFQSFHHERLATLPNVYFDVAGFQTLPAESPKFGRLFQASFTERMLFGSDWPMFNFFRKLDYSVERLREIGRLSGADDHIVSNIFSENCLNALNISLKLPKEIY